MATDFGMCNKVESSCLDFEIMIHEWVAVGCTGNRLLLNIIRPLAYSTFVIEKLVLYKFERGNRVKKQSHELSNFRLMISAS